MIEMPAPSPVKPVSLSKLVSAFKWQSLTPSIDVSRVTFSIPNLSRPSLQLAGFYGHFNNEYLQMFGRTEMQYLSSLTEEERNVTLSRLFKTKIPCLVLTHGQEPHPEILLNARLNAVPVYSTNVITSEFSSEVLRWLKMELAPSVTIHGVLLDIYGEGIVIMGESGVGKSETALQLIKQGHRLIADDAVEIRRIATGTLMGTCPSIIQYFTEIRGIGVINIRQMFGVEAIKGSQVVDLVLYMEHFDQEKSYDRMGNEEYTIDILGQEVPCLTIPIRPGRNLAVICEAAAINHRQKKMGYNAAKELSERLNEILQGDLEI